ncbi:hypothetical protein [Streptomyces aureus]|jgi:hypothetical protein|uniref:hypothetical protein n=1 Tax=Streptomyces aureus TaxID=193461 RepID=UPI00069013E4|nr:hypothetical protein [Streptomyces aureus]
MTSDESTPYPEPSPEDIQADPPPGDSDEEKSLHRRIVDGWNGLGVAGKLGVAAAVAGAIVLVAAALSSTDETETEYNPDQFDDSTGPEPVTRMYTNHAGGYYVCSHTGCSKKINHIYMTDHDCCGRCSRGRDCMKAAASEYDGPGGFPHTYFEGLLYPGVCTVCGEGPEGHRSDDPNRWPDR